MAEHNDISLTVVVGGVPEKLTINPHDKVGELMRKALNDAGQHGAKIADWSLRFAAGGPAISPDQRIREANITAGTTLFLDPNEGGGGNASAPSPSTSEVVLVDPDISRVKLNRQLENWKATEGEYRGRGYELLACDGLTVDVAFHCRLPLGAFLDVPATPLAVRFDFRNYDVWAPSLGFIDPLTREPLTHPPALRALDFRPGGQPSPSGPLDAFIDANSETKRTFLCKRGVREYHMHFEHSGDDWLLYRDGGLGTLSQLCDVLWRLTTRTVVGITMTAQRIQIGGNGAIVPLPAVQLHQADVDALTEQVRSQMQAAGHRLAPATPAR